MLMRATVSHLSRDDALSDDAGVDQVDELLLVEYHLVEFVLEFISLEVDGFYDVFSVFDFVLFFEYHAVEYVEQLVESLSDERLQRSTFRFDSC